MVHGIRRAVLLALCIAWVLQGCQNQAATIELRPTCNFNAVVGKPGQGPAIADVPTAPSALIETPLNSVNITDFKIANKIMIQDTKARRSPAGTVEVWARFVNCTDFPLQLEARTHFLDEAQAPAEGVSGWNRVFLPPRAYGVYQESSTNVTKVRYYYVEVREGI